MREHQLGVDIYRVLSLDEMTGRAPCLYGVSLSDCWIAYVETSGPPALRASTIIVIDRASGRIIYRGSANDEG